MGIRVSLDTVRITCQYSIRIIRSDAELVTFDLVCASESEIMEMAETFGEAMVYALGCIRKVGITLKEEQSKAVR